ncbi:MAG: TIGR03032 family protein [Chthoniobacteraceae bacterium]
MESGDVSNACAGDDSASFDSSYTSNFSALLRELGVSLVVSTYQAGKLILVRADGDELNTHFRHFFSPMGVAYLPATGRLAIGAKHEVWEFRNQPDVAAKLEPIGRCDAAFLPRTTHYSGDIRIHEIAWLDRELWAVNTRFSCLCTFDGESSFVPRWRPPFVSALSPEDRCHLNGMAVVDAEVKFVTCLGATDTAGGWRANKRDGGLLLDVASGETLVRGLSMPHSPRVHAGKTWLLESGRGTISVADLPSGKTEVVAKLPGFTRGLDFLGHLAFVGLSQVRDSAVFSGIPLVEELSASERSCGVWVIDLRSGETIAFLRFEGIVQEIFAVQVLPGIVFPDLVNEPGETLNSSFVLPDEALRDVPRELRADA